MTSLSERARVMALVSEAVVAGARQDRACKVVELSERTLQRWQGDQAGAGDLRGYRGPAISSARSNASTCWPLPIPRRLAIFRRARSCLD